MRKLFLIISLFFAVSCIGQIPSIGAFQIPGIQQEESGWCTLENIEYDNINLVHTGYPVPSGTHLSEDGTMFYVTTFTAGKVLEYTLSTPFDLSTASLTYTLSTTANEGRPNSIYITSDGGTMYIGGQSSGKVTTYTLTSAFDISSATFVSQTVDLTVGPLPSLYGISFNNDGTIMFIVIYSQYGNSGIYAFPLTTAWDATSTTSYSDFDSYSRCLEAVFSNNGYYLYLYSTIGYTLKLVKLSIAYDITSYQSEENFYTGFDVRGISVSSDGQKIYLTTNTNTESRQYSLCP